MTPFATTHPESAPTAGLPTSTAQPSAAAPSARPAPTCGTELDARGRPPPHPLDLIRVAVAELEQDEILQIRTRNEPIALVLALASPDIAASAIPLPDQTWRTTIRRR